MTEAEPREEKAREADLTAETVSAAAFEAGRVAAGNRWMLYIVGGASIIAGLAAIFMPFIASFAAAVTVGACLVFSGIVGLIAAFRRRDYWHMASAFGLSLLAIVAGVLMLLQPLAGIFALTTLIIAWLGASGALRVYYGIRRRHERGAGWMLASGIASVAVALLLWFGMPFNAAWVPGLVLGLDLLIWGALLIALAVYAGSPASVMTAS